ncbi:MAG: hypothetical protein WBA68_07795 [Alteraurantiacibacter sp.]
MSYVQAKRADVGELLGGTFAALKRARKELAIYFGAFFAIGLFAGTSSTLGGLLAIGAFIGYFVGQYWLYQAMLRYAGLLQDERMRVFGLFFMALLLVIPVLVGLNFLFVPGVILVAKWVMAPAYLVAKPRNLFEALGESWRASDGNTVALALTVFVLGLIWVLAFVVLAAIGEIFGGSDEGSFGWLAIHLLPVFLMGLSVTAYRRLVGDGAELREVFA